MTCGTRQALDVEALRFRPEASICGNLAETVSVLSRMNNAKRRAGAPEWLILIGACVFIFALGLSAYWEADIRWLHFFQAWMYVGTIMLSLRGSRWGQFIGFSAAGLWAYGRLLGRAGQRCL